MQAIFALKNLLFLLFINIFFILFSLIFSIESVYKNAPKISLLVLFVGSYLLPLTGAVLLFFAIAVGVRAFKIDFRKKRLTLLVVFTSIVVGLLCITLLPKYLYGKAECVTYEYIVIARLKPDMNADRQINLKFNWKLPPRRRSANLIRDSSHNATKWSGSGRRASHCPT